MRSSVGVSRRVGGPGRPAAAHAVAWGATADALVLQHVAQATTAERFLEEVLEPVGGPAPTVAVTLPVQAPAGVPVGHTGFDPWVRVEKTWSYSNLAELRERIGELVACMA
jgi:hypothetical protein